MEKRGLELGVGLFLLIGLACLGYLSFKLGDVHIGAGSGYDLTAKFSTVAGLKARADVSMAGVSIGRVKSIRISDGQALVTLRIDGGVQLEDDSVATIKTMGLIGEKYISISPGASDVYLKPDGVIHQTQPPLDIENLLGKFVFGNVENSGNNGNNGNNGNSGSAPPKK